MKSAILSVGTELLFGQITNTNAVYLSQQLQALGIDVMYHFTVGDNSRRLADIIRQAFKECDLIITTGGLGPTQDDLTKEIVCQVMNDELIPHQASMNELREYFKKSGREMTGNNWKQGYFPSRAQVLANDIGTAPGFVLQEDDKTIICMPGPPREMYRMFERYVSSFLAEKTEDIIYYKVLRLFGIGESKLETEIMDLIDNQTDPTLAIYAKEGECSIRITSKRKSEEEARKAVETMIKKVEEKVGQYIYSYDNNNLEDIVVEKLIDGNITIACAESCTGGWFAKRLTDAPGISAVFDRGLVTYSNRSKVEELGVKQKTLDEMGAVSKETAIEMAKGLKERTGCRLCISVTGVAGPEGAGDDKPVGTVYYSAILDDLLVWKKTKMRNVNRIWNRNYAVMTMLDMINRIIDGREL
ncbi:MAG: competence/damage-inducible protein A [Anaerovoracaceae bacterium]|jgi:nicotinamide-nucleotide amidase